MLAMLARRRHRAWASHRARLLIEAEAAARQSARIVELDPDPDAQREARILFLVAQRLRGRRRERLR